LNHEKVWNMGDHRPGVCGSSDCRRAGTQDAAAKSASSEGVGDQFRVGVSDSRGHWQKELSLVHSVAFGKAIPNSARGQHEFAAVTKVVGWHPGASAFVTGKTAEPQLVLFRVNF
jgi:hypothetical protein